MPLRNPPVPREDRIFFTHDIAAGMSSHPIADITAGVFPKDHHVDKLAIELENAPGSGKTVTVTVSDEDTTMTVNVSGDDKVGSTTDNNYDWVVATKKLQSRCSTSGGTAAGAMSVTILLHELGG
jgi:hypothetical protein